MGDWVFFKIRPYRKVSMPTRRTSSTGFDSWQDGGPEAATWEDIATIKFQFPDFSLEDKVACTGEVMLGDGIFM